MLATEGTYGEGREFGLRETLVDRDTPASWINWGWMGGWMDGQAERLKNGLPVTNEASIRAWIERGEQWAKEYGQLFA